MSILVQGYIIATRLDVVLVFYYIYNSKMFDVFDIENPNLKIDYCYEYLYIS